GLYANPWRRHAAPALRGVARSFTPDLDPGRWRPNIPYAPFEHADRFDMFWGAKIVARFTREQIHAAVEAGRYSDARAIEYLTDTLVARQRLLLSYWFSRVNPVDNVVASQDGVCFDDLAIIARIFPAGPTHCVVTSRDRAGRPIASITARGAESSCSRVAFARDRDGYTIVEIATIRPGMSHLLYAHVARDPATSEPRVIGLWRI